MTAQCEDRDGWHIYKGKVVYAVHGYPAECMECGAPIPYEPRGQPMIFITRAEFNRRYPDTLPKAE